MVAAMQPEDSHSLDRSRRFYLQVQAAKHACKDVRDARCTAVNDDRRR